MTTYGIVRGFVPQDDGKHTKRVTIDGIELSKAGIKYDHWCGVFSNDRVSRADWIAGFPDQENVDEELGSEQMIRIREWILLMRLYQCGDFFVRAISGNATNFGYDPSLISYARGKNYKIDCTNGRFQEGFKEFCSEMRAKKSWDTNYRSNSWFYVACEFFLIGSSQQSSKWHPSRMISYWTAIESCVSIDEPEQATKAMKERVPVLVGTHWSKNKISNMYGKLRSDIVHGRYSPSVYEKSLKKYGHDMELLVREVLIAAADMPPDLDARNLHLRRLWSPTESEGPASC